MDYPVWDVAIGGGVLMGVVAIAHVVVSHFAIGGGLVIVLAETLAASREDRPLRELARRSSWILILLSTVFGAISGVGIWVVAGLISPGAISALIHEYVWGWAIEWTFFVVEIVAALIYYSTWGRIRRGAHLAVGWIYVVSAYLSLVVINGIITFMLTPGRWLETGEFWDGFFNPTYWPSLVLRTGICVLLAASFMMFAALRAAPEDRPRLLRFLGWWVVCGVVVAYAGYRWWEAALPEPAAALFLGATPVLEGLAGTRTLSLWALVAALLIGGLAMVVWPRRLGRTVAAVAIAAAAITFFGGYERVREGVRKPFLIHSVVFSNGLRVADIDAVNRDGLMARTGWVGTRAGVDASPTAIGEQLFRHQCSSCHTLDGYQAIRPLLPSSSDLLAVAAGGDEGVADAAYRRECSGCHPDIEPAEMRDMLPTADDLAADPEFARDFTGGMISATLEAMRDMGAAYVDAPDGRPVDPRTTRWPAMPPFVGTDDELEALAAYLAAVAEPVPKDAEPSLSARAGGQ